MKLIKTIMTKDKSKVTPPKGATDHELLLMILSKVEKLEEFQIKQEQFNNFVIDQFKKHGWVK